MRFGWTVFCLFALAGMNATGATSVPAVPSRQTSPPVAAFVPPAIVLAGNTAQLGAEYFAVRANTPADVSIAQIAAAQSAGFVAFDPRQTYELNKSNALWLHFRVQQGRPIPADWSLVLSKPFIDKAEFYFQDVHGVWRMQAAGTEVAHRQWPVKGLTPQFYLGEALALAPAPGTATDGPQDYYIRVQKWIPLRFAVEVKRTEKVTEQTQNTFLAVGLLLGLLGFMFIFSCVLSVLYRNRAYAFYAAYVAAALMAAASFSGIASYAFWPAAVGWPAISTMVFVLLGLAAQLAFTRSIFIAPGTPRVWAALMTTAIAAMLLASAVFVAVDQPRLRLLMFALAIPLGFGCIAVIAVRALRHDRPVAALYLLSFAPMLAVVLLTQIEQLGLAALPWLPYNIPIYGLILELPLLLIALHLHAKNTHTQAVRSITLAHTDPLTGFVAPALYPGALSSLWAAAQHAGADLAVVYVKVIGGYTDAALTPAADKRRDVLKCVRMLRTVARDDDTIARVTDAVFAMLMPGVSRSERLTSKLSRLVALGVMVDSDDTRSHPIKFKIAASTLQSFSGESAALDEALRGVLAKADSRQARVISFVTKRPRQPIEIDSANANAQAPRLQSP
jgi:two-component system, sensor histidine kinase LadS